MLSRDGIQQGDVLSCMLYAVDAHDNYVNSLDSNSGVSGLAVVDDFYTLGPYGRIFQPFDCYGTEPYIALSDPIRIWWKILRSVVFVLFVAQWNVWAIFGLDSTLMSQWGG